MEKRISEKDLKIPALLIIKQNPKIDTSILIEKLINIMQPKGKDAEIINRRKDTYFSQKVRNLKSHNTLVGFANYNEGLWTITSEGEALLNNDDAIDFINYTINNPFEYQDKLEIINKIQKNSNKKLIIYDENDWIFDDGKVNRKAVKYYNRSKKLREIAVYYFSEERKLLCNICGFEFEKKYGQLGRGYIEIHHKKPLSDYENEDVEKTLKQSLANLIPVCSNCHRMLHRTKTTTYDDVVNSLKIID